MKKLKQIIFLISLNFILLNAFANYPFVIKGKLESTEFNNLKICLTWSNVVNYKWENYKNTTSIKNNEFLFKGFINEPFQEATIEIFANDLPQRIKKKYSPFLNLVIQKDSNFIIIHKKPLKLFNKNFFSNYTIPNSDANILKTKIDNIYPTFWYENKLAYGADLNWTQRKIIYNREKDIIQSEPKTYYSLMVIADMANRYLNAPSSYFYEILNTMPDDLKKTALYDNLNNTLIIRNKKQIDSSFFDFRGVNIYDSIINRSQYKNKLLLVTITATWCRPCKENIPFLKQLVSKYKHLNFDIIELSIDGDKTKLQKYINLFNPNWQTIYSQDSTINYQNEFNIHFVPNYFLLSSKGFIVYNIENIENKELNLLEEEIKKQTKIK